MQVAIIFGSKSDAEIMKKAADVCKDFGISYSAYVISAHRSPELLQKTLKQVEQDGAEVIIAGAGLAAHLPGVITSLTTLPVIGVPIASGGLGGLDALLAIVQMPKPMPVATVGINNAANAAYLACQILANKDPVLKQKFLEYRASMKAELEKNANFNF